MNITKYWPPQVINIALYFGAFVFISAFVAIMVTIVHYLILFLSWVIDFIFDPYLMRKFDQEKP
jgi:hypothetical protein